MPLDLCNEVTLLVPARRRVLEIFEEPLHLGLGGPPYGPGQPFCDLLTQDVSTLLVFKSVLNIELL